MTPEAIRRRRGYPEVVFAFGVLGFLELEDVWRDELAPDVKRSISAPAFALVDDIVEKTLGSRQLFWFTAGFLIALWEVSALYAAAVVFLGGVQVDALVRRGRGD